MELKYKTCVKLLNNTSIHLQCNKKNTQIQYIWSVWHEVLMIYKIKSHFILLPLNFVKFILYFGLFFSNTWKEWVINNGSIFRSHLISIIILFASSKVIDILIICVFQYLTIVSFIKLCINIFMTQGLVFEYVYVQ